MMILSIILASAINLFSLSDVRVTEPDFVRIQEQQKEWQMSLETERVVAWFRREAGLTPLAKPYPGWDSDVVYWTPLAGNIVGFWMSGLSYLYESTGDEAVADRLREVVMALKEAQDASGDGYLHAILNGRHLFEDVAEGNFEADVSLVNHVWEPVYIMNKIMSGLYDCYKATSIPEAKDVITGMADWFGTNVIDKLSHDQVQSLLFAEHGSINESFADVYNLTGDLKYLRWAERLNEELMLIPAYEGRDILNGWHANTQIPKFTGFEMVYRANGDERLSKAARFFWKTVAEKHSWAIGGNSTGEHFFPVEEFEKKVTEIGGPESCNSVNFMRLTETLYEDFGELDKIDYYERVLFNHILANYEPEEGMPTYYTPMRPGQYKVYGTKYSSFWCCVTSGMLPPGKLGKMIYATRGNELLANLFISSTLNWKQKGVRLTQNASFPECDASDFVFECSSPTSFSFCIRNPWWNTDKYLNVEVNGRSMKLKTVGGYAKITRKWKNGDKVSVRFKPELHLQYVPNSSKFVHVLYGPIVLATKIDNYGLDPMQFKVPLRYWPDDDIPWLIAPAITDREGLIGAISRKEGEPMTFVCDGSVASEPFELVPFYRINLSRYEVCYPVYDSKEEYDVEYATQAADIERTRMFASKTVDRVILSHFKSEQEHCLDGVDTRWADYYHRHWRDAGNGGYFMYRMKVLSEGVNSIYMKFVNDTEGPKVFDILVDGKVIATLDHSSQCLDKPLFYYENVDIPENLTRGKESVTVKFQARRGNTADAIFDLRIVKKEI